MSRDEGTVRMPGELTGTTIDHFEIGNLLGRGGMGEVYEAADTRLGRPVAVKIITELYSRDAEFAARFEREARAASTINHRNVAQVYTAGLHGERRYYVMELVRGASLAEVLRRDGRISGLRCLSYLRQACQGLAAALAAGIIHRDIKPANLMLDAAGTLKIVDFGLARRLSGDESLTHGACVLGTPRYMSPEQALAVPLDHRSDIYSLGATFYHLFAGEPPFDADTPIALMMMHTQEPLPPLKARNPLVPAPVCAIVERMLAKDVADRYQSYDELLAEIDLARAGKPLGAAPPARRETGRRTLPTRPRTPLSTVVPVMSLVVVGVAIGLVLSGGGKRRRQPEPVPASGGALERQQPEEPRSVSPEAEAPAMTVPDAGAVDVSDPSRVPDEEETSPVSAEPRPTAVPRQRTEGAPGGLLAMAFNAKSLANIRRLSTMVEVFIAREGRAPDGVSEFADMLEPGAEADLFDGWGHELAYERLGTVRYRIASAGADGIHGSADDVVLVDGRVISGEPSFIPQPSPEDLERVRRSLEGGGGGDGQHDFAAESMSARDASTRSTAVPSHQHAINGRG